MSENMKFNMVQCTTCGKPHPLDVACKINYKKDIDNMREAMGTLPSQAPKKTYSWKNSLDSLYVAMNDWTKNPYKAIVSMCTATWGDNETGSTGKWNKLTPENRYRIVLACLTGNTLPQALEAVQFTFEVNGVPRHTFDQHARARIGTAFASIGTRDNNKNDSDFLLYPDVCRRLNEDPEYRKQVEQWIKITKDLYEETISHGQGSWQSGRAFLPMSTNHSYAFVQNYLALKGQCARRLMACEEAPIVSLHMTLRSLVEKKWPLLANYLRPACDGAKKCIYSLGPEGLTKYFSNLFKGCGRWPDPNEYSEFNVSCSSYEELEEHGFMMPGPGPDGWTWIKYGENDFDKLHPLDIALFSDIPTDRVYVDDQWVHINQGPEIFDARK